MNECPICFEQLRAEPDRRTQFPNVAHDCPRCGQFVLRSDLSNGIGEYSTQHRRSVLSHRLRCIFQPEQRFVFIGLSNLISMQLDDPLPPPAEQADRLVVWIGDHQPSPAEVAKASLSATSAWIGAAITRYGPHDGLFWLLNQALIQTLVEVTSLEREPAILRLKMAGWDRYERIKRAEVASRTAFMAMRFSDDELTGVVEDYFKPAVDRAGFALRLSLDGQQAGLIDDQLRVRLRTSRFTIAESDAWQQGAYWEAGFAEGLGRPVIYTCRKAEWDRRDDRDKSGQGTIYFDTNHMATIIWDPAKLNDAAEALTAMIRATLPAEAKMTDKFS